jgi:hypothetical protein
MDRGDLVGLLILQPKQMFPDPKRAIGRWIGPSKTNVCDLVYKVLKSAGNMIHTSAVEPVTQVEKDMITYQEMRIRSPLL